jgi:hypothetical protein
MLIPSTRQPRIWARFSVLNLFIVTIVPGGWDTKGQFEGTGEFVEIKWATVCREIRETGESDHLFSIDILGANQDQITFDAPLPADVPLEIAVCVAAAFEEVRNGAEITITYVVRNPHGQPVFEGYNTFGAAPLPEVYPEQMRHALLPLTANVLVATEGLYSIDLALPGGQPYSVTCRMTMFPH